MVHMPSLEIWEWGLKIFRGAPTLTTHVDRLLFIQHKQTQSSKHVYYIHVHNMHVYMCIYMYIYVYVFSSILLYIIYNNIYNNILESVLYC